MIRSFFVEIVFPLLLFFFVRLMLRNLIQSFRGPKEARRPSRPGVSTGGELKKDPVCGTYVSPAASVTRTVGGQVFYFCSKECRDKYQTA